MPRERKSGPFTGLFFLKFGSRISPIRASFISASFLIVREAISMFCVSLKAASVTFLLESLLLVFVGCCGMPLNLKFTIKLQWDTLARMARIDLDEMLSILSSGIFKARRENFTKYIQKRTNPGQGFPTRASTFDADITRKSCRFSKTRTNLARIGEILDPNFQPRSPVNEPIFFLVAFFCF